MAGKRRDYRTGSVYQRASDGLWIATIERGFTASGGRRRITVSAKTEAEAKRRRRDKVKALEDGEATSTRTTVKSWADEYLAIRVRDLAPKAYNAVASPVGKWVIPTIGHKRLDDLTPADIRAVATAQRERKVDGKVKPLKTATIAATHRALLTMLRAAVAEGHRVPARVLAMKPPKSDKSDRASMTVPEGLAMLEAAAALPHGARWLFTLLYGARQGECLGLTWGAIDFDRNAFGEAVIEWQLQALPYIDRKDKARGFRIPDGYEHRHLVDSWHLVRPKSKQGYRVAPFLEPVRDALLQWREVAPASPHDLVWPEKNGRPKNNRHDLAEWHALQATAGVAHPDGRPYHVHECRNFAATMLLEAGVDEHIITALLGHSSIVMSRKYMTVRREPLLAALQSVGDRLQLGVSSRAGTASTP